MEEIFDDLNPDEVKLLKRKIKEIERELLKRIWRQVQVLAVIAFSVLTVGGVFSFSAIKDSIINSTSEKLKNDSELRGKVISDVKKEVIRNVSNEIEGIQELKTEINSLSNDIENERIIAQEVLSKDLKDVRKMLETIYLNYSGRLDSIENE